MLGIALLLKWFSKGVFGNRPASQNSSDSASQTVAGNCSVARARYRSTVLLKNFVLGLGPFSFVGLKRSSASIASFAAQFGSFGSLKKAWFVRFPKKGWFVTS
jgi:hypothetical protein